jgi:hypothetical protein
MAIIAIASIMAHAAPAQIRDLSATGRQDLTFDPLLPGVPTVVTRLDAIHTGQFEFRGERSLEVRVEVTLPAGLIGPMGQLLTLQFGPADGGFGTRPALKSTTAFDPRVPLVTILGRSGRLYLFLGGAALPTPTQRPGNYSATITATVAYTGV